LILILTILILFSGCVEENTATKSNESAHQDSVNITPKNQSSAALSSKEENIPEIKVTSFSSIYMYDNSGDIANYIFSWDNVPGSESYRLRDYLRDGLGIGWINTATIIKAANNDTIRVFTPIDSLELKLADDKNTALIIPNNIQLKVKEENSKLCIFKTDEGNSGNKTEYNITGKYYTVYGLSIKNNGSKNIDFRSSDLSVRTEDNIFNVTIKPENLDSDMLDVLSDLEKETKLENITLSPGQTINGSVVFQVNSLYNESFLLMYNETPVPSTFFEKSIQALNIAEGYNYSVIFGIPPYNSGSPSDNSFNPYIEEFPYIWANWVNRSIFEFFNRADFEDVEQSFREGKPTISIVYALKVIPERNITFVNHFSIVDDTGFPVNNFIVIDDAGEKLINTSKKFDKTAILKNQTYERLSEENRNITQMNISNANVVRISFKSEYMWGHYSFIDQDVIMDKELNIIAARNSCRNFVS
jgi:hypothetical protein